MTNELVKLENAPELQGVEKSKAEQIRATFAPMVEMLSEFEESYNLITASASKEITKDVVNRARRLRIDIGAVRIATEKIRVAQKEEYLRAGKAIDGVSNILKWAVTDKENKLKEIETYFETQEKMRLEALQVARAESILQYLPDAYERRLYDMPDDVWEAYFSTKKREYLDRIAAEVKAEADRIEREKQEEAERQRIKAENERLKKEADEREKAAKIEAEKRAKEEAQRKAKEDAERAARIEAERKQREEYEANLKAERDKAAKIQAELKAKEDAERAARIEAERIKQAELNKGDQDKVTDLINDLKALQSKYTFESEKNKTNYETVKLMLQKIINTL